MHRKIYVSLLALVMALSVMVFTGQQSEQTAAAAPASQDLLGSLPASDFILYVDAQRALTDIIPNMVMTTPERRARYEADLNRIIKDTGLDPRLLDAVAVGAKLKSSTRMHDAEFAIIARGRFDATATIETGLAVATKESRGRMEKQSQQYEGRTIYTLAPAKSPQTSQGSTSNVPQEASPLANVKSTTYASVDAQGELKATQIVTDGSEMNLAFVALDANTIAFGQLKRVRATIDASMGRDRVSDELVQLATRTPGAVMSFSGNVTPAMVSSLRFPGNKDNNSAASIRQVYGAFNITGSDAEGFVHLRTETAETTRQLSMMLNALKLMAKFGGAQAEGKAKLLEPLIKGVSINAVDNEVQVTLKVAQADIAPFLQRF